MVKVLHVELGRHLYGGARQVAYLLNGLAAFPGKHILACCDHAEIMSAIDHPEVEVHPLPFRGDLDFGFISRLRHCIREHRPNLLHIHSRRGDGLAALAGQLERVTMIHSRRVDNPPSILDTRLKFPLFETVVTISEGIREVLIDAGVSTDRVVCIPSAVDTERYRPKCDRAQFQARFGLAESQLTIGVIAQLIPRKGHSVLFDALPSVLEKHPNTRVLILGKGSLEARLRQMVSEKGWDQTVLFAGFHHDMEQVIPGLDLVVHPAWMEGLGVSLLEAAASGVPIVATRTGGIPEIVRPGVNGFLIEPGDSSALARVLQELIDQPELRRKFGEAGRNIALERFSVTRMVQENYRLYEQLGQNSAS